MAGERAAKGLGRGSGEENGECGPSLEVGATLLGKSTAPEEASSLGKAAGAAKGAPLSSDASSLSQSSRPRQRQQQLRIPRVFLRGSP